MSEVVILDTPCNHKACKRHKNRKVMATCPHCHRPYWTGKTRCFQP